jgi:hypothetical protein
MKILRKAILTSIGILPFITPFGAFAAEEANASDDLLTSRSSELDWRKSRFSLEAQSGSRTIGTLDAFIPFMGDDDFMVYADFMAKLGTGANNSNGNAFEGNLGLGFRRVNDNENAIYGMYAFYDSLRSVNDNSFQQITVGAERLGLTWDFRANAYLPIGTSSYTKDVYKGGKIVLDQHNLIEYIKSSTESTSTGYDVEVGRTLGLKGLKGYLAAYSFGKDLTGPRARLEYQLTDNLMLSGTLQHDKERGAQFLLGATFSVGGSKANNPNSIYSRMTDSVVRDVDVVTKVTEKDLTKVEFDRFYVVNVDSGTGGDGTVDHPYGSVDEAINAAPENAIIFIVGQSSNIIDISDKVALKDGQLLWGGYESLYWDFDQSKPVDAFNAGNTLLVQDGQGVRQTLGGNTITAGNNVGMYHFDIKADGSGSDSSGIFINNNTGVVIDDVNISGFSSADGQSNFTGIHVTGSNAEVQVNNLNLDNNDIGILVDGGQVQFKDINITNSGKYGIQMTGGALSSQNVSIDHSAQDGVHIENAAFSASNLTIDNSGANGVYQNGGSFTVPGSTRVSNSVQDGVHFENLDASTGSIEVTNSGKNGIYQTGGSLISTGMLTADESEADGVYFENVDVTANDLTGTNSSLNGLNVVGSDITINSANITENDGSGIVNKGSKLTINGLVHSTDNGLKGYLGEHDTLTGEGSLDTSNNTLEGFSASYSNINLAELISNGNGITGASIADSNATFDRVTANDNLNGNGIQAYNSVIKVTTDTTTNNNGLIGVDFRVDADLASSLDASSFGTLTAQSNSIGVYQNGGNLTIGGGSISENAAEGIDSHAGMLNLSDITFEHNGADGIKLDAGSELYLDGGEFINNVLHGLNITNQSVADIRNVSFTGNGLIDGALPAGADSLEALYSAISVSGKLNANSIIVANNAAGIELKSGTVTLNASTSPETSLISGNYGYGIWSHNADAEGAEPTTRTLNINRTDVYLNKRISDDVEVSGHGIYAQDVDTMTLQTVNVYKNDGTGVWIANGNTTVDDVSISGNGKDIAKRDGLTLDDYLYGMRIDSTNPDQKTSVKLSNLEINGIYAVDGTRAGVEQYADGLLVNGGDVELTGFFSRGNGDGIEFTKGDLTITDGHILDNKHLGIFLRNYDYNAPENDLRKLHLIDSTISGTLNTNPGVNLNTGEGYGLAVDHENSFVDLYNTKITKNQGYGVYLKAGEFKMDGSSDKLGSSVSDNGLSGIKTVFTGSSTGGKKVGLVNLQNTTISGNVTRANSGTSIPAEQAGVSIDYALVVYLNNVDIINNKAPGLLIKSKAPKQRGVTRGGINHTTLQGNDDSKAPSRIPGSLLTSDSGNNFTDEKVIID